jgi:type IX secretion system substrate protein
LTKIPITDILLHGLLGYPNVLGDVIFLMEEIKMRQLTGSLRLLFSVVVLIVMTSVVLAQPTQQTFAIIGAYGNVGDVDPYTDCSLDDGVTWQEAYLTGWHPWGFAPGTNSWISLDPNNSVGAGSGSEITEYDFRIRFLVPEDFTDPSMVFIIKADNEADIWINDTYITNIVGTFTYAAGDAIVEQALVPGLNEVRLRLKDWGGILGLNYRVDVTMTSAEDISDPVLTTEDADEYDEPYEVTIDIKPGSNENPVNPRSRGVIPVAVYTDENFDATTIDVSSLRFGPGEAGTAHSGHIEDVDNDGDDDLMLHFRTQETGVSSGDTELFLYGTAGEMEIFGSDIVNTDIGKKGNRGGSSTEGLAVESLPREVNLSQNYPNPFNPTTSINCSLPETGSVSLVVYDIQGAVVKELVSGFRSAGNHNVEFDASNVSSGTYFYALTVNGVHTVKKMLLIK